MGRTTHSRAFTLLELLLILAIIALLVQLLLPAVQAAREAARRVTCQSHLRSITLSFHAHLSTHGHLPTGGWGWGWNGDADRGYAVEQPGGWVFNVLEYLDARPVRDLARGAHDASGNPSGAKLAGIERSLRVPLAGLSCPTRRSALEYPYVSNVGFVYGIRPTSVARTDYAANAGARQPNGDYGPASYGEAFGYRWKGEHHNGVCYQRSTVTSAAITDGMSHTYMVGEKYLDPENYENGLDRGDDQSALTGFDFDSLRWASGPPEATEWLVPLQDSAGFADWTRFGSAHPAGAHFGMCDGSVRVVCFSVEGRVHRACGDRSDGEGAGGAP